MSKSHIESFIKASFPEFQRICKAMYHKGMFAGTDGNVSIRLPQNSGILVTSSGVHKGFLEKKHLVAVDWHGNIICGSGDPTSELPLHQEIYRADENTGAIIHTHAPWTTALNLAGIMLATEKLVEAKALLKQVPVVPYHPPGTLELAKVTAKKIGKGPALILERHGAVTFGENIEKAFCYMECLEHSAKIIAISRMLNPQ